jgi:hypothetical protein
MTNLQQIVFGVVLKPKSRMYDELYLSFGFTSVIINTEERHRRVLCLSVLAADSMKESRQLETKYSAMKNKPEKYLHRKHDEIRIQQNRF